MRSGPLHVSLSRAASWVQKLPPLLTFKPIVQSCKKTRPPHQHWPIANLKRPTHLLGSDVIRRLQLTLHRLFRRGRTRHRGKKYNYHGERRSYHNDFVLRSESSTKVLQQLYQVYSYLVLRTIPGLDRHARERDTQTRTNQQVPMPFCRRY